jgi:hypothetical protein
MPVDPKSTPAKEALHKRAQWGLPRAPSEFPVNNSNNPHRKQPKMMTGPCNPTPTPPHTATPAPAAPPRSPVGHSSAAAGPAAAGGRRGRGRPELAHGPRAERHRWPVDPLGRGRGRTPRQRRWPPRVADGGAQGRRPRGGGRWILCPVCGHVCRARGRPRPEVRSPKPGRPPYQGFKVFGFSLIFTLGGGGPSASGAGDRLWPTAGRRGGGPAAAAGGSFAPFAAMSVGRGGALGPRCDPPNQGDPPIRVLRFLGSA